MGDPPKYDNLTIGQVAELLGMQRRGVRKLARRVGIPAAPNWGAPSFSAEQIERMQAATYSNRFKPGNTFANDWRAKKRAKKQKSDNGD